MAQKSTSIAEELLAEEVGEPDGGMPEDMPRWMARVITGIDTFSRWVGFIVSWMTLPLFLAMVYEIIVRYFFMAPTLWAYDVSRMLYGAFFMLGAGYALLKGAHIRADFLYRSWSPRTQAGIDLTLYLVFYFPSLIVFLWFGGEFALKAIVTGERGMDTPLMPYLGPIKTALPVGIALLLVQGVSEALKCCYTITSGRWPT